MNSGLFQPNNHSRWQIRYTPVKPVLATTLTEVLKVHYGLWLDQVKTIEQVDEAEHNSQNYKVTGLKASRMVAYLLSGSGKTRDEIALKTINLMVYYLAQNGMRVVKPVPARNGQDSVTDNGSTLTLMPFIPANHFRGSLAELEDTASQLGQLDALLATYPQEKELSKQIAFPKALNRLRASSLTIWQELFKTAAHRHASEQSQNIDTQLLAHQEMISQVMQQTTPQSLRHLPKQLVHFDLHPHNLLTDGHRLLAFLDFDSLRFLPRVQALAFAMHRLVRQYVVFNKPEALTDSVSRAKDCFLRRYQEYNPLTTEEIAALPYFIRFEAVARLSLIAKLYYYEGNEQWLGDVEKHILTLKEAAYF